MKRYEKIIGAAVYPLIMSLSLAVHLLLVTAQWSLLSALYVPLTLALLSILYVEHYYAAPRVSTRAIVSTVKIDTVFLALVQVLLPILLGILIVLFLLETLSAEFLFAGPWLQHWPVSVQAVLILVIADFVYYWGHRVCHRFASLRRWHVMHYTHENLYSFNAGYFYPLGKTVRLVLTTAPFIVLGVAPHALALYLVFYSVNEFFLRSNLDSRYGWWHFIISDTQRHRQHYRFEDKVRSINFGHHLTIWDRLFGTLWLPEEGSAAEKSIFSFRKKLLNLIIRVDCYWSYQFYCRPLLRAAKRPWDAQREVLRKILHENRATAYGQRYGFDGMKYYADFRNHVPLNRYEDLRAWLSEQRVTGAPVLTSSPPLMYVRTSSTTGLPKDIPVIAEDFQRLRLQQKVALAFQHRTCAQAFSGKMLAIASPAIEGVLDDGRVYGSASGLVHANVPDLFRTKLIIPQTIFSITDHHVKYMLILRIALVYEDISYISAANPSTFLSLLSLYAQYKAQLLNDVQKGGFFMAARLPSAIWAEISKHPALQADSKRALQLRENAANPPYHYYDIWPNLKMLVTWTAGSAAVSLGNLRPYLPDNICILDLGYIASEFRGTVSCDASGNGGLPMLDTYFYEFVEKQKWENGIKEYLTLPELKLHQDYFVVVTAPNGLYRYFIDDIVTVAGFYKKTPLLRFVQKGKGFTNILGERLYENQVLHALKTSANQLNLNPSFFMLLANRGGQRYELYIETEMESSMSLEKLADRIDTELQRQNIEYRQKQVSGRLQPLSIKQLRPGTGNLYKEYCLHKGQREGQFKPIVLNYLHDFHFDLERYVQL